jgi:hypothetical protein
MAVELQRHRFTVDDYYRMAEAGILDEDSRVELPRIPPMTRTQPASPRRTAASHGWTRAARYGTLDRETST